MSTAPPQEGTGTSTAPPEGQEPPSDPTPQEGKLEDLPQWARDSIAKANREAANYRTKAQTNAQAAKELEKVRASSMTEQEKAVQAARDEAKAEALKEVGTARAGDAIRFSIGDRLPADELDGLLDDLNLARFVKDDGSVDREKVTAYVNRVAPARRGTLDLGQGARGGNTDGGGSFLTQAIRDRRRS